jgi:hypothetical protein
MGLNLLLSKAGLDYIVKDEVIQYTTKDAALRQPITMHYRLTDQDEPSVDNLAKTVQALLDKKHQAPLPQPVVTISQENELVDRPRTLVVSCNYRMHAIVRNHLRHSTDADTQTTPR